MIRCRTIFFTLLLVFFLQACASPPRRRVTPYRKKPEPQQRVANLPRQQSGISERNVQGQNPVVKDISNQANQLIRNGKLDGAAQTLERGLRIAPKNALLWSQLATVRLKQHRYGQAKSLAAKSNSFAGGDAALLERNRAIMAQAGE